MTINQFKKNIGVKASFVSSCIFLILSLCVSASASVEGPEIDFQKISENNAAYLTFEFSGGIEVKSFYLSNPERLVIDVTGAYFASKKKNITVNSDSISAVRIAQNQRDPDIVRIVFDLTKKKKMNLEVDRENGKIKVYENATIPFPEYSIKKYYNRVEIKLPFKAVPQYSSEIVQDPPRFVLDFPNYSTKQNLIEKSINEGLVSGIRISRFKTDPDVTRFVVETRLPAEITLTTQNKGRTILLTVFQSSLYKQVIAVDAGHGGKDPGAQKGGIDEKDINLDVAMRLKKLLEAAGVKVVMTRTKDEYVLLKERASIANRAGAKLFISIHANALENHEKRLHCRGAQMMHYSGSSKKFAQTVMKELVGAEALTDFGTFERKNLVVLKETRMKAVLAELAFMTHPDDMELLKNDIFKENAARGLYNGLQEYLGEKGERLAAIELPVELMAHLPKRPYEQTYFASGNVLTDDFKLSEDSAGVFLEPLEPEFDQEWLFIEEGITHEFGESPQSSSVPSCPKIKKSDMASLIVGE
ncbi:MAG TPA: N-acetylmuramoyl-L-alanine amidase [bacterium]|nr:N-acetylmuramoyl-L-alanine amidase [bacterium]